MNMNEAVPFDLNIEKILEDWEICHAIREIIANALDEQLLTKTPDIKIWKDQSHQWHIRDFGRGLQYEHLTQKENQEKLNNPNMIGKFGIGLKDAFATFNRQNVNVMIQSKYGDITLSKSEKHGFKDLLTLHAYISPPSDPQFLGTEFIFKGVQDNDIEKAKPLFLMFSHENKLESTKFGEVLERSSGMAKIYINGVKVSEEENFLFSYNITSLNDSIRKALNRERTNVGRNAYSERIKSILKNCKNKLVISFLVEDLGNYETGDTHDELKWIDIQEYAVKILNTQEKAVFLSSDDLINNPMMVDEAKRAGYRIISVPENLGEKIADMRDLSGNPIRGIDQFGKEYDESFEFKFVDPKDLMASEKEVFSLTSDIFKLIGGKPEIIKEVKISETMKKDFGTFEDAEGVWEYANRRIIIQRKTLSSIGKFAGVLLHETAHAISGAPDVDRDFELKLSELLGKVAAKALTQNPPF